MGDIPDRYHESRTDGDVPLSDLSCAYERYRSARLDLFRDRLGAIIESVSPIAADALAADGLELDDVVRGLRPPRDWPETELRVHDTFRPVGFDFLDRKHRGSRSMDCRFSQRHRSVAGRVLRKASDPAGGLGIRLCGDGLEVAILSPNFLLTTAAGKGRLQIAEPLPQTFAIAMTGRPVGDVASHPLLDGRDYPVRRVTRSAGGGATLIVFETGSQSYKFRS